MDKKIDIEEEKKQILKQYKELLRSCKPETTLKQKRAMRKAFNLANDAHQGMRRKSGEPYIYHPLMVAQIVSKEIGLGTTSIICSLLHDVVEDTDFTVEDIESMFGSKVARIVDGLTKISDLFEKKPDSMQAENFKKMLLTLSDDVRVILIKLADRLHNMRTLDSMPNRKQLKIASETVYMFAPLANRLGLYSIKSELQDLSLKYTEPVIFNTIITKLKESKETRDHLIQEFIIPIEKQLKDQQINYKIFSRTKSIHSIWEKMNRQDIPFEEVYDLCAVRVVIDVPYENEKSACWNVYSVVTDNYRPSPDRLRDWISIPKANGYESLHTTVMSNKGNWVEVQIRTERMNEVAEKGYAAHWKYKESVKAESGLDKWLNRIRDLLESNESSALEFFDDFKLNLFADEIFVFTPKGELRTLPAGSTALDFAYCIHTQIGNTCLGANVNHNLVPLSYKLKSGDQVEIISSGTQKPTEDWLAMVETARAKASIKDAIKIEKKRLVSEGRTKLAELLSQFKIENDENTVSMLIEYLKVGNVFELYQQLTKGKIGLEEIKNFQGNKDRIKWLDYIRNTIVFPSITRKKVDGINNTEEEQYQISIEGNKHGDSDMKYVFPSCCRQIPGDEVLGFITEKGIEIHRTNCEKAIQLMAKYGDRIVKARWTNDDFKLTFLVGVKFTGIDKVGLLLEINSVISDKLNTNIRSINFISKDGFFEGSITLYVHDTKHLNNMMKRLRKVDGVKKVLRMEMV